MNRRSPALIVLNPLANAGAAVRSFEAIQPAIEAAIDARIVLLSSDGAWRSEVHVALDGGVRLFVAAGGDGTAHALLNALIAAPRRPPLAEITLGAVGLGSSNDLHKPVRRRVEGIPIRIDVVHAAPRDIVCCRYLEDAETHVAHVLVSASLGCVAYANERFARGKVAPGTLGRISTVVGMVSASIRTVATWRNLPARLRVDDGPIEHTRLTNLSVLKTEWLSGWLRFGHPVDPASGDFDVALAEGGDRMRLGADVLALLLGRFDGRAGHRRLRARSLDVLFDDETLLELDGEVVRAREAYFRMLPERIRLCA